MDESLLTTIHTADYEGQRCTVQVTLNVGLCIFVCVFVLNGEENGTMSKELVFLFLKHCIYLGFSITMKYQNTVCTLELVLLKIIFILFLYFISYSSVAGTKIQAKKCKKLHF